MEGPRDHDLYGIRAPEAALTSRTRSAYRPAPILNLSLLPVLSLRVRVPLSVLPGDLPGPVHVPGLLSLLLLLSLILIVEVSLLKMMLRKVSTVESGCGPD